MDIEAIGERITEKKIAIGVIDHHSLQVEKPEDIADNIRAVLKHIPAERLILCSDCGMGREGMSRRHVRYKIVALVQGTNIVRNLLEIGEEYGDPVAKQVTAFYDKSLAILKKKPNVFVSVLPMAEQKRWAKVVPNIAAEWVKINEAKGLPARRVLEVFMEGIRARGETPLRDWDKELP